MEHQRAKNLLKKYHKGECTPEEKAIVETWFLTVAKDRVDELPELEDYEALKAKIWSDINNVKSQRRMKSLWPRMIAAASIVFCLSTIGYFLVHRQSQQQNARNQIHDIAPGGNKAILILSNGKQISLTSAKNGNIAVQGSAVINKTADGEVVYQAAPALNANSNETLQYNLLETPRGGKYDLTLSDGTKVWLNAASSIKYPTSFTGHERRVEIKGEAYFEVVHNAAMPFRVTVNGQTIEDLGTHFNINSYPDEPVMKATLLQGSIKISNKSYAAILKPGQQASVQYDKKNSLIDVSEADTEEAVAWHLGLFKFNNADIKTIMRQIGRWYDVDVAYEGNLPKKEFSGEVYRTVNASEALQILKYAKVNFRIENKKITLIP